MKRLLQWICLTALAFSATSCGLPQMLGRTAGNTLGKLAPLTRAASSAALF
ncbi:MAG: hypothetical protein Q8Q59_11545 [Luteolibacter sp.]|jgi:hypothetical protein|nr:hypothetical protein [Luteolibacter sp.]